MIPVIQHVEGNDRSDDQERQNIYQRQAAGKDRGQDRCQPHRRLAGKIGKRGRQIGAGGGQHILQPLWCEIIEQRDERLHVARQVAGKAGDLVAQHRQQQQQQDDDGDDAGNEDEQRRGKSRQPQPFQGVGDRIEEISQHKARNEGQHDVAQQPERQDHDSECRRPKDQLALQCHEISLVLAPLAI